MSLCITCGISTNNYKCPRCNERYCSVQCYKIHKEGNSCNLLVPQNENEEEDISKEPTLHEPFSTEDTVALGKLEMLRTSPELLHLLYNPHLRNLLQEIDIAPNAWIAMRKAMQEPLFIEFADECLKIIEPIE